MMSELSHFEESLTSIGKWLLVRISQIEFNLIHPFLKCEKVKFLEIGPGIGAMPTIIKNTDLDLFYVAVEPNEMLAQRLQDQGFIVKSYFIPEIMETDQSFDCIYLSNVFEHLGNVSEASLFVSEAYRVLKPGGILCISSPDYLAWQSDFFNSDYTHTNITTVRTTMQIFYDNGLSIKKYFYLSGFIYGIMASLLSFVVRLALMWVNTNHIDAKLYKIKLTFSRRFLIIGQKK